MRREVYSGRLKLQGEEHRDSLLAAEVLADSLLALRQFAELKSLLQKTTLVARRVLGEKHVDTLKMRWLYANALFEDDCATLDDLREAVETLGSVAPLWTRVFGPSHPDTPSVQRALEDARKVLAARASASSSGA